MEGFPGGMMGPMGPQPGMMMHPGMMGMDLPFPGQGPMDGRKRMWPNEMGFQGSSQSIHPNSKEGSVFYKTRLCNRFAEGNCSYGDRCNYAHSQAELRTLPPEGQRLLDMKNKVDPSRLGASLSPSDALQRDAAQREGGAAERSGVRGSVFKSRLCTRFMQKGECAYGPNCHFAHGMEDMQGPDRAGMGPQEGPGFEMPFPGGGLVMPGGPMMPPEFMAMAMGGMPGGPMMPPRPRPPPGPPPSGPSPGTHMASPERDNFPFDVTRTPTRMPSDVPYLDKVRAMCALMGVGALKPKDAGRDAIEAAISALHSGEAMQANAYADALDVDF